MTGCSYRRVSTRDPRFARTMMRSDRVSRWENRHSRRGDGVALMLTRSCLTKLRKLPSVVAYILLVGSPPLLWRPPTTWCRAAKAGDHGSQFGVGFSQAPSVCPHGEKNKRISCNSSSSFFQLVQVPFTSDVLVFPISNFFLN